MADIINLNRFRKAKARADDKRQAAENRVVFGRTKAEKQQAEAARKMEQRALDGARITPPDDAERE